jgi:hypothetical protein
MVPSLLGMSISHRALRVAVSFVVASSVLSGCGTLDKARVISDLGIEKAHNLNVDTLVEAEIERQRFRRARCYSPLLSPAAVVSGTMDHRLGRPWLNELLRDCPQFSALIAMLVVDDREQIIASRMASQESKTTR